MRSESSLTTLFRNLRPVGKKNGILIKISWESTICKTEIMLWKEWCAAIVSYIILYLICALEIKNEWILNILCSTYLKKTEKSLNK